MTDTTVKEHKNTVAEETLRLHIGGAEAREGWKILNIQPGPHVDFVGDCREMSQFADNSVSEIYASHVLEHLGYSEELPAVLRDFYRILKPMGSIKISVPDFEKICRFFPKPGLNFDQRIYLMRMAFGGQTNPYDYHKVGLTEEILTFFLTYAGFSAVYRVTEFGLFNDSSSRRFGGHLISLNVEAIK